MTAKRHLQQIHNESSILNTQNENVATRKHGFQNVVRICEVTGRVCILHPVASIMVFSSAFQLAQHDNSRSLPSFTCSISGQLTGLLCSLLPLLNPFCMWKPEAFFNSRAHPTLQIHKTHTAWYNLAMVITLSHLSPILEHMKLVA